MQLSFDAADRLVELVQARHGPVNATDAARELFALASAPTAIARSLLDEVVTGDARLQWRGASVGLADDAGCGARARVGHVRRLRPRDDGLSPRGSRIVEIGAQRVDELACTRDVRDPRRPGPAPAGRDHGPDGHRSGDVRGAPREDLAVRRFLAFAGDAVLVAHNARFDMAFLDHAVVRLTGPPCRRSCRRHGLARAPAARGAHAPLRARPPGALLRHRSRAVPPRAPRRGRDRGDPGRADRARAGAGRSHRGRSRRALRATRAPAAREAEPRRRRAARPGHVSLQGRPRAAALRRPRPRPRRAAALLLFRRAAAPGGGGGARGARGGRVAAAAGASWRPRSTSSGSCVSSVRRRTRGGRDPTATSTCGVAARSGCAAAEPTAHGPLSGRAIAQRAARALEGFEGDDPRDALPALRRKLRRLASDLRFEDAARLRDRITAVEQVVERLDELARARALRACLVVPALEPGMVRAVFVAGGVVARRTVPRGGGAVHEIQAGLAEADSPRPARSQRHAVLRARPPPTSCFLSPPSSAGRRPNCASSPSSERPSWRRCRG